MISLKRNTIPFLIVLFTVGCSAENWKKDDQDKLLKRCLAEGGTKSYCKCYLENAMEKYPDATAMDNLDFESAVDLSIDCN